MPYMDPNMQGVEDPRLAQANARMRRAASGIPQITLPNETNQVGPGMTQAPPNPLLGQSFDTGWMGGQPQGMPPVMSFAGNDGMRPGFGGPPNPRTPVDMGGGGMMEPGLRGPGGGGFVPGGMNRPLGMAMPNVGAQAFAPIYQAAGIGQDGTMAQQPPMKKKPKQNQNPPMTY